MKKIKFTPKMTTDEQMILAKCRMTDSTTEIDAETVRIPMITFTERGDEIGKLFPKPKEN